MKEVTISLTAVLGWLVFGVSMALALLTGSGIAHAPVWPLAVALVIGGLLITTGGPIVRTRVIDRRGAQDARNTRR